MNLKPDVTGNTEKVRMGSHWDRCQDLTKAKSTLYQLNHGRLGNIIIIFNISFRDANYYMGYPIVLSSTVKLVQEYGAEEKFLEMQKSVILDMCHIQLGNFYRN